MKPKRKGRCAAVLLTRGFCSDFVRAGSSFAFACDCKPSVVMSGSSSHSESDSGSRCGVTRLGSAGVLFRGSSNDDDDVVVVVGFGLAAATDTTAALLRREEDMEPFRGVRFLDLDFDFVFALLFSEE